MFDRTGVSTDRETDVERGTEGLEPPSPRGHMWSGSRKLRPLHQTPAELMNYSTNNTIYFLVLCVFQREEELRKEEERKKEEEGLQEVGGE